MLCTLLLTFGALAGCADVEELSGDCLEGTWAVDGGQFVLEIEAASKTIKGKITDSDQDDWTIVNSTVFGTHLYIKATLAGRYITFQLDWKGTSMTGLYTDSVDKESSIAFNKIDGTC